MIRSAVAPVLPAAAILLAVGCKGREGPPPSEEVSRDLVQIVADKQAVRTGEVGAGKWKKPATYVLVEARNTADRDLMVTLAGDLTEATGALVSPLRAESLRVPAGGSRLFALVDDQQAERPTATGASVRVAGAATVSYPPPVIVTDGHVYSDKGRAVVAGNVVNTATGQAHAIVVAAFFDRSGAPMTRPSTLFELDPGGKRGTQMVGPEGSTSAYLFIGEVSY